MRAFLEKIKKTYCFDYIGETIADDVERQTIAAKILDNLKTLKPVFIFKILASALEPALRYYCGQIRHNPFVLKYIHSSSLNFPIEQLYTVDLNVLLLIYETSFPFIDFLKVGDNILRYVFIDVLFTSKEPGHKTWYDVILNIAIWDGKSAPYLIDKPEGLKYYSCRDVDATVNELQTRVILSTYLEDHNVIESVAKLFKIPKFSRQNAINCSKYFDNKEAYREVPFIHPLQCETEAFLSVSIEYNTIMSHAKQFQLYQDVLRIGFDRLRKEEKMIVDDFDGEKKHFTRKQSPLLKKKRDKSQTWEVSNEYNFIIRILCEKNGIDFGKNALKVEENFTFKEKPSSVEHISQILLFIFEKIEMNLKKENVTYIP